MVVTSGSLQLALVLAVQGVCSFRAGWVGRRSITLQAEPSDVDVNEAWLRFKATLNTSQIELAPDEEPQREPFMRNEVRAGVNVGRQRSRDRFEEASLTTIVRPESFAVLGALVVVIFVVYLGVFLLGGIDDGAMRYAPFEADTSAESFGAVVPGDPGGVDGSLSPANAGPIV